MRTHKVHINQSRHVPEDTAWKTQPAGVIAVEPPCVKPDGSILGPAHGACELKGWVQIHRVHINQSLTSEDPAKGDPGKGRERKGREHLQHFTVDVDNFGWQCVLQGTPQLHNSSEPPCHRLPQRLPPPRLQVARPRGTKGGGGGSSLAACEKRKADEGCWLANPTVCPNGYPHPGYDWRDSAPGGGSSRAACEHTRSTSTRAAMSLRTRLGRPSRLGSSP